MDTKAVVERLGGAAELARDLGMAGNDVGAKAVRAWARRDSIPAKWFVSIERAAQRRSDQTITASYLAKLADRRRDSRRGQP